MRALRLGAPVDPQPRTRELVPPARSAWRRAIARLLLVVVSGVLPQDTATALSAPAEAGPHALSAPRVEPPAPAPGAPAASGSAPPRVARPSRPSASLLAAALLPPPPPPMPSAVTPARRSPTPAESAAAAGAARVVAEIRARGVAGEPRLRHLPGLRLPWLAHAGDTLLAALSVTDVGAPTPDLARDVTLPAGWSLVSVPLVAVNTQAPAVFADLPAPLNLYDFSAGATLGSDEPGFRNAVPGRAFWLLLGQAEPLSVVGAPLDVGAPQRIALEPGWNAVATPWLTPVAWSDARVSVTSGAESVPLAEAVTRGWLDAGLYQYDAAASAYQVFAANAQPAGELRPWQGSLVHARVAGELVFTPPPADNEPPLVSLSAPSDASSVTAPTAVVGTVDDPHLAEWRLELAIAGSTTFSTIARGGAPVQAGALGTLDPTLLQNGQYDLKLSARDTGGRTASAAITVTVKDKLKVGHFRLSFVDLEVPLGGLPIEVVRTYDSRDKGRGDFGIGWRLELSDLRIHENGQPGRFWRGIRTGGIVPTYCIEPARPRRVSLSLPDGRVLEFEPYTIPDCQEVLPPQHVTLAFRPLPGTQASLEALDVGTVMATGSWPTSQGSGPLTLIDLATIEPADPQRYQLTLPDGGVTLTVDQVDGLQRVRDEDGNELAVGPQGIVHSSGRGVAFERDALGRITRITDPLGHALRYTYDASGDLTSFRDRAGQDTTFEYADQHFLTAIHDPLGRTPLRSEYDAAGRLVRHTDAAGHSVAFTHDVPGGRQVVTDRLGRTTLLAYDLRGNIVQEVNPAGETVTRTFDERGNRLSETDGLGHTTTWTYDAADNVRSVRDPLDHVTTYTYNGNNRVLTSTDARGLTTRYDYDPRGHLSRVIDAAGQVSLLQYDELGHLLSRSDPLGQTTTFDHDPFGNETLVVDPAGHASARTYDAAGRRLSETRTRLLGGTPQASVTTWAYDREGRATHLVLPGGERSLLAYSPDGREASRTDALGRTRVYEHDALGRRTRTVHPDGTFEAWTYDPEGHVLSETDRAGRVTRHEYDAVGRRVRTLFADATEARREYDLAGRLIAERDETGQAMRYEYDAAGRRIRTSDPLGREILEAYDEAGNRVALTDANGQTTTFTYDALDRVVAVLGPDGSTRTTTYDAGGRVASETDELGRTTLFAYDSRGLLVGVTDPAGATTSYAYDELGQRVSQTDALGRVTHFEYDLGGRVTRRVLPGGAFETFAYDAAGNRSSRTDFAGRNTSFSYDSDDRLTERRYPDGSQVALTYAATGERLSATDARGTTSYAYDVRGRLASVTYPDGRALTYGYDAAGRRASLGARLGGVTYTTTSTHDASGRLTSVSDLLGRAYTLETDSAGNPSRRIWPNGISTSFAYDARQRLTRLTTSGPGGLLRDDRLSLADDGRRELVEETAATRSYAYDAQRRLLSETVNGALAYDKGFVWDAPGNRTRQTTAGSGAPGTPTAPGTDDYAYDARDRLLAQAGQALSYDVNGNLTARAGEATYTWDFDDRLVRVERADGTRVEHAYDVDGLRVRSVVTQPGLAPQATDLLVDPAGELGHVVAESDAGSLRALYVRAGDALLAVLRPTGAGQWSSRFYHADALGSVRALSDETGQVTDTYEYTAFGEPLAHVGADPQPYGFAGEAYEPIARLSYNRARWYDPRTGRFLSLDPWWGDPRQPDTLHRYAYAASDPVNASDPSGLFSLMETSVGKAVQSILQRIATSRPIRFLSRGLRNKRWNMRFNMERTPLRLSGPVNIWHAYMYAEEREAHTGFRYDIGIEGRFRGVGASIKVAGYLGISPESGSSGLTVATHNNGQFGLWNAIVVTKGFEPPGREKITYSILGPFFGQSCWSWTIKAAVWAFALQIFPIG